MLESENTLVKLTGAVVTAASIAFGGLSSVITLLIGQIGSLAYRLGSQMIDVLGEFTKRANKADAIANQFMFTIKGFNREFGADKVGSIEQ
jgi:hypothetical protein